MRVTVALALLAMLGAAVAYSGVDVSENYGAVFSCLVSQGYNFAIIRGYEQVGQPDPNCTLCVPLKKLFLLMILFFGQVQLHTL
jgi:hypothetical protein